MASEVDTYTDRMRVEVEDLQQKIVRLTKFFDTETFRCLPEFERYLMYQQRTAMANYCSIVILRIALIELREVDE